MLLARMFGICINEDCGLMRKMEARDGGISG